MSRVVQLFKEKFWAWLLPLAFLVVNLGLLSTYRTVYAGRVVQLEHDLSRQSEIVRGLEEARRELDDLRQRAEESRRGVEILYRDFFSTKNQRLTDVIREVEDLARRSGMLPDAVSYPEQNIEDHGLIKKSFVFSVTGDYVSLRKLINFLELSDSYLVLESISVNETGGPTPAQLSISMRISTLFSEHAVTAPESPQTVQGPKVETEEPVES
jgi:type IV pilus assembly protein PilO